MFRNAIKSFALIAAIATAATVALPTPQADAASGRRGAFALGAITGLAVGAIAANPRYRRPPPQRRYYRRPAPWTPAWYRYCSRKYRSFNPRTGYFITYSGYRRFCR